MDLRDALGVLQRLKVSADQRSNFAETENSKSAISLLDLPLQFEETDCVIRDAFLPIFEVINEEVSYMREKLITNELENATMETFEKGFQGFDAYSDEEIVELYNCTYGD